MGTISSSRLSHSGSIWLSLVASSLRWALRLDLRWGAHTRNRGQEARGGNEKARAPTIMVLVMTWSALF